MPGSRRIRATFVQMLALGGLLALMAAPASAQPAVHQGEGTGVITSLEETSSRDAGSNRIAERTLAGVMVTGPLEGTFTEEVRGVVHGNGRVTFQGVLRFEGTLEHCGDVTLTARLAGRGEAGEAPVTEARMALVGSSAVSGQGIVEQHGSEIHYEVDYVCR